MKAAKMVQLDEMIKQLPKGYETNMQETGQRFSGGERQRIALARILLQNTPIVILDEPTVVLIQLPELKLLNTIFETLEGKTIIWVTHHLIGVEAMNRILFLEQGKIAMEGTHISYLKMKLDTGDCILLIVRPEMIKQSLNDRFRLNLPIFTNDATILILDILKYLINVDRCHGYFFSLYERQMKVGK